MQQTFIDQLKRPVSINFPLKRIISLVPSQTELLFDLGLDNEIVGLTRFCHHPAAKVKAVFKIGGTKNIDFDLIRQLSPDVIIGNKEENEQAQIEALMQEFPVWMSDIYNLNDALQMITSVGTMVNKHSECSRLVQQIETGFKTLTYSTKPLKIAYMIWQKPYMVAAKNTFIDDILQRCGWLNAFDNERYPQITDEELRQSKADVIMLSSEPYPFKDKHAVLVKQICPQSQVILVDGEMFSWYGSRLLKATDYFNNLIAHLNELILK